MAGKLDHVLDLILEGNEASHYSHGLLFGQLIEGHGRVQQAQILRLLDKKTVSGTELPELFIRFTSKVNTNNSKQIDPNTGELVGKRPKLSNIPKLGMNVLQSAKFNTPQGIYAYGVTDTFYNKYFEQGHRTFADTMEFINVFSVKSSYKLKVLDIGHYTEQDLTNDIDKLKKFYPKHFNSERKEFLLTGIMSKVMDIITVCLKIVASSEPNKQHKVSEKYLDIRKLLAKHYISKPAMLEIYDLQYDDETSGFAAGIIRNLKYLQELSDNTDFMKATDTFELEGYLYSLKNVVQQILDQLQSFVENKEERRWFRDALVDAGKTAEQKKYPATRLWNVTRVLSHRLHGDSEIAPDSRASIVRWTAILRKLGYEWVYDFGIGLIHGNEPQQVVFFHGGMFDVVWQGPNPKQKEFEDIDSSDFQDRIKSNRELSNAKLFRNSLQRKLSTNDVLDIVQKIKRASSPAAKDTYLAAGIKGLFQNDHKDGKLLSYALASANASVKEAFWKLCCAAADADYDDFKSVVSTALTVFPHIGKIGDCAEKIRPNSASERSDDHTPACIVLAQEVMYFHKLKLADFDEFVFGLLDSLLTSINLPEVARLLRNFSSVAYTLRQVKDYVTRPAGRELPIVSSHFDPQHVKDPSAIPYKHEYCNNMAYWVLESGSTFHIPAEVISKLHDYGFPGVK
jgi:hypothetical protein